MEDRHWQDIVTGIVGLWLIAFPFLFDVVGASSPMLFTLNFLICGIIALLLAATALTAFRSWEEWIGVVLGLWLIASPWLLGFVAAEAARWNALVAGVIIVGLAGWALMDSAEEHA